MYRNMLLMLAAIVTAAALVFVGCSGSGGPTLPPPAAPDRPDPTPIVVEDLIIPVGEERRVEEDTVFTVEGTVQIDGVLTGADGSGAGAHGVDITIEAEGDIAVAGLVQAGSGADGTSGEAGGDGGSVRLTSTGGDITIGAEDEVAVAGSGKRGVHAGDGGDGGEGLLGGAGGEGGSVVLACASGTLTIHEAPDLFHVGNGGHGGQGVVLGEEMENFDPPPHLWVPIEEGDFELPISDDDADGEALEIPNEVFQLPSHGGNGGRLGIRAAAVEGPETEAFVDEEAGEMTVVFLSEEVADGGGGGDAGAFFFGVDPETAEPAATHGGVRPSSDEVRMPHTLQGAHGGSGFPSGGAGGDMEIVGPPGAELWPGDRWLRVKGGEGGPAEWNWDTDLDNPVTWRTRMRGGTGGSARVWARQGLNGGPCEAGQRGDSAYAEGGKGGDVRGFGPHRVSSFPGSGGNAQSRGGRGGDGGHCCHPPGEGGGGGYGGYGTAIGGDGGRSISIPGPEWGAGGDASALSGGGGMGGNGWPPGIGNLPGISTARGGTGIPDGNAERVVGPRGGDGERCPEPPEPTPDPGPTPDPDQPTGYGVTISNSPTKTIYGHPGFYTPETPGPRAQFNALRRAMMPGQSAAGFTIGGPNHPVLAWLGQSMIFSPDNLRLWVGSELGGMCLYRNPLTNTGDRAPDLELHIDGTQWFSIWYEAQGDTLYATTMSTGFIYAWDGASNGNTNRAPDRTIEVPGYHGGGYLIGAHGSDTLFMAARVHNIQRFLVFYDAHELDGLNAANRYFEPEGFNAAFAHALSWDVTRDFLYYGMPDRNEVHVHENASNLSGDVTPDRTITVPGIVGNDWISGVIVAPYDDLLFVSTFDGDVMVFRTASGLQGTVDPATRQNLGDMALGLGVFRQ